MSIKKIIQKVAFLIEEAQKNALKKDSVIFFDSDDNFHTFRRLTGKLTSSQIDNKSQNKEEKLKKENKNTDLKLSENKVQKINSCGFYESEEIFGHKYNNYLELFYEEKFKKATKYFFLFLKNSKDISVLSFQLTKKECKALKKAIHEEIKKFPERKKQLKALFSEKKTIEYLDDWESLITVLENKKLSEITYFQDLKNKIKSFYYGAKRNNSKNINFDNNELEEFKEPLTYIDERNIVDTLSYQQKQLKNQLIKCLIAINNILDKKTKINFHESTEYLINEDEHSCISGITEIIHLIKKKIIKDLYEFIKHFEKKGSVNYEDDVLFLFQENYNVVLNLFKKLKAKIDDLIESEQFKHLEKLLKTLWENTLIKFFEIANSLKNDIKQNLRKKKYQKINWKLQTYSRDDSIIWEFFPYVVPSKYNFLDQINREKEYKFWDLNKSYLYNKIISEWNKIKEKQNYFSIEKSKNPTTIIDKSVDFEIKKLTQADLLDGLKFLSLNDIHLPELKINFKNIFNFDIDVYSRKNKKYNRKFISEIKALFKKDATNQKNEYYYQDFPNYHKPLDSILIYSKDKWPKPSQNIESNDQTFKFPPFSIQAWAKLPFKRWARKWLWFLFKKIVDKDKTNRSEENIIHEFNNSWFLYKRDVKRIPLKTRRWYHRISKKGNSICEQVFEYPEILFIRYKDFNNLRNRLQNFYLQWKTKVKCTKSQLFFFKDIDFEIKSNKSFVKFQHRNKRWFNFLFRKKHWINDLRAQIDLAKKGQWFFNDLSDNDLISTFKTKKQMKIFYEKLPKIHKKQKFYFSPFENFFKNFDEKKFWLLEFKSNLYAEYKNNYLSEGDLKNEGLLLISREINEIHKLLNSQKFSVFPIVSSLPEWIVHEEIGQINKLLNENRVPNALKIEAQNMKDIYIPNFRSDVNYLFEEKIESIENIVSKLKENMKYFKKWEKMSKRKKQYIDIHPFFPSYEKQCSIFKRKIIRNLIKDKYTIDSPAFLENGLSKKFEHKILEEPEICPVYCDLQSKICNSEDSNKSI